MDKRSIIAIVLISIIITAWLIYTSVTQRPEPQKKADTLLVKRDTQTQRALPTATTALKADTVFQDTTIRKVRDNYGKYFQHLTSGTEQIIRIETDLVKASISTKGATIIRWELKNYRKWDQKPTQLIQGKGGELYMSFITFDAKRIDTRKLYFDLDNESAQYRLTGKQSLTLTARLVISPGKEIIKKITFYGNKYEVGHDIELKDLDDVIPGRGYNFIWSDGIAYQEGNSVDESGEAHTMASLSGDLEELDASDAGKNYETTTTGMIYFAGLKTKYFGAAIIPQPYKEFDGTADLSGKKRHAKNGGMSEKYDMSFRIPYKGSTQHNSFKTYIGPLDYDIMKSYGLQQMVNLGWKIGIRQIGEYFLRPLFLFIHSIIPNYGIVLIIFSLIIKILLYPLSIQQMRSAQKMKLLTPIITELREKYKEDNAKQQKETMKLYSEYGINPAGGCLPLLLQMPILFALWQFLRSAIDLRQAHFALWISDLSIPDVILDIGFKLPIFNIDRFSGLAVLMGITMFIQQKMTVTDPRQKALVYVMPIMFTLMFSNFPSGLNLYYFMFNLFSIVQQYYMNNLAKNKLTLADLKRMPKKEGWLQKKMREAQDIAASQGRSIPGKTAESEQKQNVRKRRPQQRKSGRGGRR